MESPHYHKPKNNMQTWVKVLLHFSVFFTTGFIAAFVPPHATMSILSDHFSSYYDFDLLNPFTQSEKMGVLESYGHFRSTEHHEQSNLIIVVTTTRSGDRFEPIALTRMAHSLAAVPPPLLWVVVEAQKKYKATAEMLRGTKVMYRHLTYGDNFTVPRAEIDHQRNLALRHIQQHRLAGVVHFTDASVIYDLMFFEELRKIKKVGVWPVASVGLNRRKVIIDGPICEGSNIVGWFTKDASSKTNQAIASLQDIKTDAMKINVLGLGFYSSILWEPGSVTRTKSTTNTTKEFVKFVMEEATREEESSNSSSLKGLPLGCSQVVLWHLHIPKSFVNPFHS